MKIGYINTLWGDKRNIIGILKDVEYVQIKPDIITYALGKLEQTDERFSFLNDRRWWFNYIYGINDIDIIHSFNNVCFTRKPWVSTVESVMPRLVKEYHGELENLYKKSLCKKGIEAICKDNCKQIISLSQSAYDIQSKYLTRCCSKKEKEIILNKTIVLHPPQKRIITLEEMNSKFDDVNTELRFLLVGNLFWRKGGAVVCKVLSEYRKKYPIKLVLISNFLMDDDENRKVPVQEKRRMLRWISENRDWITCYNNLPNKKVLTIAKNCHVGLLPSYDDTYGYSVLELQASGCPVITTDTRALPEINNNTCGWICEINKFKNQINYKEFMNEHILGAEFKKAVCEILNNTDRIKEKGFAALEKIEEEHSPKQYAKKIKEIYLK